MKYKGIVGAWKKTEVNTPAVKLLSIVTDTKKTQSDWSCFLPKHEITDKERATAQMIAASHQMYSALKALVDLKEWKNVHGTAHTLLIETLYGQRQNMRSSWL
jgi:hypothetical protein